VENTQGESCQKVNTDAHGVMENVARNYPSRERSINSRLKRGGRSIKNGTKSPKFTFYTVWKKTVKRGESTPRSSLALENTRIRFKKLFRYETCGKPCLRGTRRTSNDPGGSKGKSPWTHDVGGENMNKRIRWARRRTSRGPVGLKQNKHLKKTLR